MEFKFPDVGEGLSEGTLLKWLVKVGDNVTSDQPIAQVETDKAVVDIPIPSAGVVKKLVGKEGETLTVGDVMLVLDTNGDTSSSTNQEATKETKKVASAANTVKETDEKSHDNFHSQSTSDFVLAMPSVRKYAREHNLDLATVKASGSHGQVQMADLDGASAKPSTPSVPSESTQSQPQKQETSDAKSSPAKSFSPTPKNILATPSVRRLAREKGIDIASIVGSGDNGRILADDLHALSENGEIKPRVIASIKTQTPKPAPQPSEKTATALGGQRVALSKTRQVIAKHMKESVQHTASVTTCDEVDVTQLYASYEAEREKLADEVKLSFLSYITKTAFLALKKYPVFNATLDEETQEMIMHDTVNIGIAVATPRGLLVPVIKDVEKKSIKDVAGAIIDLATRAREGKLSLDEMKGSTFTISNIGSIGGQMFTPIINYPEVAILGVGRALDKPAVVDGEIQIRKLMWLSLTFDHRVVDGADAAFFLNTIKNYLEDEQKLLTEMS